MNQRFGWVALLAILAALARPCPAAGAVSGDLPRPAVNQDIETVRQTIPAAALAPAPAVSRWEPIGGNVDQGVIIIEGQGFDTTSIVVRHSGNALTLLEKSPTRVVARLGTWSGGSGSSGPLIVKHSTSETRVLSQNYPVRPRWPSTSPRVMEVQRLTQPAPRIWGFVFESAYSVRLLDVPGDEVVEGELVESSDSNCAFATWRSPIRFGNGPGDLIALGTRLGTDNPIPIRDDPATFESGGRGAQELYLRTVWLGTMQANADRLCDIRMRMKVRYRDLPLDVRIVEVLLRGVPSPSLRKRVVVHDTYALLTSPLFRIEGSVLNTPFACGYDNHAGVLRFYLNWIPTGSNCDHTLWFNKAAWRNGYALRSWTWQGPPPQAFDAGQPIPRCRIFDTHPRFPRMTAMMGWDGTWEDGLDRDVIRTVYQECLMPTTARSMNRPNEVHSRLLSVELEVPANSTSWRDAVVE